MTAGDTKVCSKCGRVLPITEFYWDGYDRHGRHIRASECRQCWAFLTSFRKGTPRHPDPTAKVCTMCHLEQPASGFYRNGNGYLDTKCKACRCALRRQHYIACKAADPAFHKKRWQAEKRRRMRVAFRRAS